jgi:hypothetical protein
MFDELDDEDEEDEDEDDFLPNDVSTYSFPTIS